MRRIQRLLFRSRLACESDSLHPVANPTAEANPWPKADKGLATRKVPKVYGDMLRKPDRLLFCFLDTLGPNGGRKVCIDGIGAVDAHYLRYFWLAVFLLGQIGVVAAKSNVSSMKQKR
jgi:hypothetical protein